MRMWEGGNTFNLSNVDSFTNCFSSLSTQLKGNACML